MSVGYFDQENTSSKQIDSSHFFLVDTVYALICRGKIYDLWVMKSCDFQSGGELCEPLDNKRDLIGKEGWGKTFCILSDCQHTKCLQSDWSRRVQYWSHGTLSDNIVLFDKKKKHSISGLRKNRNVVFFIF